MMNSTWLIALALVVILIASVALIQQAISPPKRRTGRARKSTSKRRDHGAHVAKHHGHERSPEWSRVRREHLRLEPACAACGHKGRGIQVHHIKPFHLHPQLELDPKNLITLCEIRGREHHLLLGHLNSWESYNERVRDDVRRFYRKTSAQIQSDSGWQKKMAQRP